MASSRRDQMESDANKVAIIIQTDPYTDNVRNVVFEDFNFHFELNDGRNNWHEMSICFSEDYPDETVIWGINSFCVLKAMRATALEAFNFIAKEFHLPIIPVDSASHEQTYSHLSPNAFSPNQPSETDGEEFLEPTVEVDPFLRRDVAICQDWAEDECCTLIHHSEIFETADIVLRVPMEGMIQENMANAWGLEYDKNIRIQLFDISVVNYRLSRRPRVEISQEGSGKTRNVTLKQLERILCDYLDKNWRIDSTSSYERGSILQQICSFILGRLPTLCDFCVICDERHIWPTMLMPSVCNRDLCVFAYETLGVMADFDIGFNAQIEVTDLVLKMFCRASVSQRYRCILEPFPLIPDPLKKNEMAISDMTRDYERLLTVLKKLPCMANLRDFCDQAGGLVKALEKEDPLLFPLIRWVIASNRTYLMKLTDADQLSFMRTPHQYLMMIDSPAKEAAFCEAKKQHGGSIFAFHGSPFENWHSILRRGLINAWGSKLQLHGAAHGVGIYLSPLARTSLNYCHKIGLPSETQQLPQCPGGRFLDSSYCECIALCEVIPTDALQKPRQNIWVLTDPNLVCTRFLILYDKDYWSNVNANCEDEAILREIRAAVKKFRMSDD